MTHDELKRALIATVRGALADLDPARLVHERLPPLPPKRARVRVVAVGKAAYGMARGAFATWGERIDDALVVVPVDGRLEAAELPRTTLLRAPHPIFDERSEAAADEALSRARELDATDVLLALISGGASALVAAPASGIDSAAKRAVVRALLEAGAPIRAVNTARRHLSRIKGGHLALAATPARTLTLFMSDVIGGEAHDVGSGPSVPDPSSIADAQAVLARYVPELGPIPLSPTLAPGTLGVRTRAVSIASPELLAERIAARLAKTGLSCRTAPAEEGEAREVAARRVAVARSLAPGQALVIACEPSIRLPEHRRRGGRAGFVALAALLELPEDVALLCFASDGRDGDSGAAGALVTGEDARRVTATRVRDALETFDDASLHEELGTHVTMGPTGHNLSDVHVLARRDR